MLAIGKRFVSVQGRSGLLEIRSKMEKLKDTYPVNEVNSSVMQKMNVDSGGGVKFGK